MTDQLTYTWSIAQIEAAPTEGDLTNVAKTVHWRLAGTDGDESANCYGSIGLTTPESDEDFIAFEDLDEETVIGWVTEALDADAIKEGLANTIAQRKTPSIITPQLPWS